MGQYSRVTDKFTYHVEDLNCEYCLHYKKRKERKNKKLGCGEDLCRYTGILVTAIINGNIKRERGHFKCMD